MPTYSRTRSRGASYGRPFQRSTIVGEETPSPSVNRPPDASCTEAAACAISDGVRVWIGTTPVARPMRPVTDAHAVSRTKASAGAGLGGPDPVVAERLRALRHLGEPGNGQAEVQREREAGAADGSKSTRHREIIPQWQAETMPGVVDVARAGRWVGRGVHRRPESRGRSVSLSSKTNSSAASARTSRASRARRCCSLASAASRGPKRYAAATARPSSAMTVPMSRDCTSGASRLCAVEARSPVRVSSR